MHGPCVRKLVQAGTKPEYLQERPNDGQKPADHATYMRDTKSEHQQALVAGWASSAARRWRGLTLLCRKPSALNTSSTRSIVHQYVTLSALPEQQQLYSTVYSCVALNHACTHAYDPPSGISARRKSYFLSRKAPAASGASKRIASIVATSARACWCHIIEAARLLSSERIHRTELSRTQAG